MCAVVACTVAGCAKRGRAPAPRPQEPPVGYAYTAVLMGHHPLQPALEDLERAVEMMGGERWPSVPGMLGSKFETVAFPGPYGRPSGLGQMAELRSRWLERHAEVGLVEGEFSEDLAARLEWEREQARQRVEEALSRARAGETRRLAQLQARLVREQQERLNNLPLDLSASEAEVARRAEAERKRIWAAIHAQVAAEKEASGARLAELEERLQGEAEDRVSAAEQAARDTVRQRAEEMARAGEALRAEMADEMGQAWAHEGGGAEDVAAEPTEANLRLSAAERMREEAEAAGREAAWRQQERLARAQARLRRQLKRSTEIAALAVAQRRNLRLELLPGGARRGSDMTELIAAELDELWNAAHRSRS